MILTNLLFSLHKKLRQQKLHILQRSIYCLTSVLDPMLKTVALFHGLQLHNIHTNFITTCQVIQMLKKMEHTQAQVHTD